MKRGTIIAILLLGAVACTDNSTEPPLKEVFQGRFIAEDHQVAPDSPLRENIDTVRMTIEGKDYRLDHLGNLQNDINLCSSGGDIGGFGTNRVVLTPRFKIPGGQCDSVRIPSGEFDAAFIPNTDSLIIGPKDFSFEISPGIFEDYTYTFRLTK